MKIEIIAIGDELTSGRILNTTSSFAARRLFTAGYEVCAINTIGDTPSLISTTLQQSLTRADAILVTGGLGSTDDDITTEAVSQALNRPRLSQKNISTDTNIDPELVGITSKTILKKLAWLPSGAERLSPHLHIAGYHLIHNNIPIFFLPGVPSQMQQLLVEEVLPKLSVLYKNRRLATYQRIFRIFDLPEVEVNRRILDLDFAANVHIGYYPVFPEVHLSLTAKDKVRRKAELLFASSTKDINTTLGDSIYGYDHDSMAKVVGRLLGKNKSKLAVAESCTGGLVCKKISNIPGCSSYFLGGIVAYDNAVKTKHLGVPSELLATHGAVSEEVAKEMAIGMQTRSGADIALALTGVAGPDGGTEEKPVGTVYIAIVTPKKTLVREFHFNNDREQIRELAATSGLNLIRKYLLKQRQTNRL